MDRREASVTVVGGTPSSTLQLSGEVAGRTVDRAFGPGRFMLGSAEESDLVLCHPSVSRRHAVLRVTSAEAVVEDLGSRNGIFLNGARVERAVLQEGDVLHVGLVSLVVGPSTAGSVEVAMNVACSLALLDQAVPPGADWSSEPPVTRQPPLAPQPLSAGAEKQPARGSGRRRKRSRRPAR